MIIEISGICQHCAEKISVLTIDGDPIDECSSCGQPAFSFKPVAGMIYVVNNPNQKGVKIGQTSKPIDQRLKALNSTGVAGNFEVVAVFPSDKPAADEKRVHEKLKRFNFAKEHFDLSPIDAVLGAYRALNKRRPVFYDHALVETFDLRLEKDRVTMLLRLSGQSA